MATQQLPNQYSTSDLQSVIIRDTSSAVAQLTPMIQLFSELETPRPGEMEIRLIARNRLAQIGNYDPVANAGTSGYEAFLPGVGPKRSMLPEGLAETVTVRDSEEYHHGDFSMAVQDISAAIGRAYDVKMTEKLEAAASTSVSYTTDAGAQTAYLLATSGAPWYTKNATAFSQIIASGLSPAYLSAARAKLAKALNWYDGKLNPTQPNGLILMTPPEMTDLATTITKGQAIPLSLDTNVGDVYNALVEHGIVVLENPLLTSATRTYLFNTFNKPFRHAQFTPWKIKINDDALPQQMTATVAADIGVEMIPFATGVCRIGA